MNLVSCRTDVCSLLHAVTVLCSLQAAVRLDDSISIPAKTFCMHKANELASNTARHWAKRFSGEDDQMLATT